MHYPDWNTFRELAREYQLIPVYRRLVSDTLTPVTAFHKIDTGGSACLFESVIGGEKVGRYSFLAADPFLEIAARETQVSISEAGRTRQFTAADPLQVLRQRLSEPKAALLPGLPPFGGGAVGYAGYDVVRYTEDLPHAPPNDLGLPDLAFGFYHRMIVFDNIDKTMYVVVTARVDGEADAERAYREAQRRGDETVTQLTATPVRLHATDIHSRGEPTIAYRSNFRREDFEEAVRKCVRYIQAGDIFQVVISQRLELELRVDPFEMYRTLRVVNPSPFMFFLRTPEVTLVGSSPEIMCRVVGGKVTVRPLAGTRRRGATEEEDRRLAEELLADPKERAEHVMLVDLGRNDVGRVAQFGSVELSDVMVIERYSHVMHITSNVSGQLAPGQDGVRRPPGLPARRHRLRRSQGAGDGDHRRTGAAPPRSLRRRRGTLRLSRQHGHLHRPADDRRAGRQGVRPGGRRHRGRQPAGTRVPRNLEQSPRPAALDRNHRTAAPQRHVARSLRDRTAAP